MNKTQTYYNQNHKELIERYNSATLPQLNKLFKKHIQKSHKVLDIGFGSGRDLRFIHSLGAECWGVDATEAFVTQLQKEPYFRNRLCVAKLPLLELPYAIKFDVIVCIAVIMHLTKDELRVWVEDVKNYLATNGKIILSYSPKPRTNDERFFEDLSNGVVSEIFLDSGFKVVDEVLSFDELSRDIEWRSEVYQRV